MAEVRAVEVRIWDRSVGAIAPLSGKPGIYEFEYEPSFTRSGLEISPLVLPNKVDVRYSFPALNPETFRGLPGVIADALPDKFGNALVDAYMARKGIRTADITTLQRLLYTGHRAMGALEFEPAMSDADDEDILHPLEMASLVEDARRALRGDLNLVTKDIIEIGSSAGGARAKALIGWNRRTNEIVSGQFELRGGFEHWLLKFDVGDDGTLGSTAGFGRIEYAHYKMATTAGIDMSECHLHEENARAHFMTKRFDRTGNSRIHMHSLCGLAHLDFNAPYVHGYEQYLRAILEMKLGAQAIEQAWRRCAFNVAAVNCDDHSKNLAFLMDERGSWRLAPAFDMCFAHNPGVDRWTRKHQMLVRGKAWDITGQDLVDLGTEFGVNQPKIALQRIVDAMAGWPRFAKEAGVPPATIRRIAALHPLLVVRPSRPAAPTRRAARKRSGKTRRPNRNKTV